MSKGVQVAGGATLVALLLGWYALANLEVGARSPTTSRSASSRPPRRRRTVGRCACTATWRLGSIERDVAAREVRFAVQNTPPHAGGAPGPLARRDLREPRDAGPVQGRRRGGARRSPARRRARRLPRRQGAGEVPLQVRGPGAGGRRRRRARLNPARPSERGSHGRARCRLHPLRAADRDRRIRRRRLRRRRAPRRLDARRRAQRAGSCRPSSPSRSASLFIAFATGDFRLSYVAAHSARSMAMPYRLAALWGGQAGSLLLWLFMLCAYASACVLANRTRNRGADALGVRGAAGERDLLPGAARPSSPIRSRRCRRSAPVRRRRAEPAAPAPGDDDPPAHALHRAHGLRRCRSRSPSPRCVTGELGTHLVPDHAALDALPVALPVDRHHARRALGLRGARLGRLLGLGSGRERLLHALAARPPPICTR